MQTLSLVERFRDSIEAMKSKLIADHPERFQGYGLSNGKGKRMTELRTNAQWAVIEEKERARAAVVAKARAMIEWAHTEYEAAKVANQHNLKMFTLLTLNWSAQRVFTKHKDFAMLCHALNDSATWSLLSRKERAFIADAVHPVLQQFVGRVSVEV
jgi:hypothetical protein